MWDRAKEHCGNFEQFTVFFFFNWFLIKLNIHICSSDLIPRYLPKGNEDLSSKTRVQITIIKWHWYLKESEFET